MTPYRNRVSISLKLTLFLLVWTAGTLAAVALFYAVAARDVRTYQRVIDVVAADAQRVHRVLDARAPLGTTGRERFRALSDLSDSAIAALRAGGQFQGVSCKPIPGELRELFEEIEKTWKPTRAALIGVTTSTEAGEPDARKRLHAVFPRWQADVSRMQRSLVRRAGTIRTYTINTLSVIAAVNAFFLVTVLWLVRRFIIRPVKEVHAAARRIASGDFTATVPVSGNDEISALAEEFNRMSSQLQDTMGALRNSASALARTNRELEEYAYAAAHDLQEPSRTVTLYSQLLRRRCNLTSDGEQYVSQIETSAERLMRIVNDLLLHSRSVHEPPVSTRSDPNSAIAEAIAHHGETIEQTRAVIVADTLPPVLASEPDLELVFRNLIGNSLKYRSEVPPEIRITASLENGNCTIRVRDNGIGISPEYHERVFGLFKRLHGQEIPGTGVGLAITRKLIEKHGGSIRIESEPGQGATFVFDLPAASVATAGSGA